MRLVSVLFVGILFLFGCSGEWERYPIANQSDVMHHQIVQSGDVISVSIFDEPNLSKGYSVSSDGSIQMPLVGNIAVSGKTLQMVKKDITDAMKAQGYLVNPQISLSIEQSQTVFILGEVIASGEYGYKAGMTVLDLVAKSGGFSYRANQNKFDIIRKIPNEEDKVIKGEISTRIKSGDVIRVRERFF